MKSAKRIAAALLPTAAITFATVLLYGWQATRSFAAVPPALLSAASSADEIMRVMEAADRTYDALHVVVVTDERIGADTVEEVWLSKPLASYRHVMTTPGDPGRQGVIVSDGVFTSFPSEAGGTLLLPAHRPEIYRDPAPGERQPNQVYTSWVEGEISTIGLLLSPKEYVRIEMKQSKVTLLGEETLIGRKTIKMSVMAPAGGRNVWVDAATGIILKSERIGYDGEIAYIQTLTEIDFDPVLSADLFYVDHSLYDPDAMEKLHGTPPPLDQP